jgi:hypothetical protein
VGKVYRRFRDLPFKGGQVRREQIRQEVLTEIREQNLKGIRELLGKTQAEVAKALEKTQGEVSTLERREDHLLSTLRRYVEALGGELEVIAHFGDKRIRLHGV